MERVTQSGERVDARSAESQHETVDHGASLGRFDAVAEQPQFSSGRSSDSITPFENYALTFDGELVPCALRAGSSFPAFAISTSNLPLATVI